jgi:hypothetical protein
MDGWMGWEGGGEEEERKEEGGIPPVTRSSFYTPPFTPVNKITPDEMATHVRVTPGNESRNAPHATRHSESDHNNTEIDASFSASPQQCTTCLTPTCVSQRVGRWRLLEP